MSWFKSFRRASDSLVGVDSNSSGSSSCFCCSASRNLFCPGDSATDTQVGNEWESCLQFVQTLGYSHPDVVSVLKRFCFRFMSCNGLDSDSDEKEQRHLYGVIETVAVEDVSCVGHSCQMIVNLIEFMREYVGLYVRSLSTLESHVESDCDRRRVEGAVEDVEENGSGAAAHPGDYGDLLNVMLEVFRVLLRYTNNKRVLIGHGSISLLLDHCLNLFDIFNPVSATRFEKHGNVAWDLSAATPDLTDHLKKVLEILRIMLDRDMPDLKDLDSARQGVYATSKGEAAARLENEIIASVGVFVNCLQILQIICAKSECLTSSLYGIQEIVIRVMATAVHSSAEAQGVFLRKSGLEVLFAVLGWKSCFARVPESDRRSYASVYSMTEGTILRQEFRSQLLALQTILGFVKKSISISQKFVSLNGGTLLIDLFLWVSVHGNRLGGTCEDYKDIACTGNCSFRGSMMSPKKKRKGTRDFFPKNYSSFLIPSSVCEFKDETIVVDSFRNSSLPK